MKMNFYNIKSVAIASLLVLIGVRLILLLDVNRFENYFIELFISIYLQVLLLAAAFFIKSKKLKNSMCYTPITLMSLFLVYFNIFEPDSCKDLLFYIVGVPIYYTLYIIVYTIYKIIYSVVMFINNKIKK